MLGFECWVLSFECSRRTQHFFLLVFQLKTSISQLVPLTQNSELKIQNFFVSVSLAINE